MAARLAMPRLVAGDLEVMDGLVDEMRRCADAGDTTGEAAAEAAFHAALVDRAGNATLRRLWGQLEPYSRTYITIAVPGADRREMADLHAPVLDALRSGDASLADDAIRQHFSTARASLAERWPRADAVAGPDASARPAADPMAA